MTLKEILNSELSAKQKTKQLTTSIVNKEINLTEIGDTYFKIEDQINKANIVEGITNALKLKIVLDDYKLMDKLLLDAIKHVHTRTSWEAIACIGLCFDRLTSQKQFLDFVTNAKNSQSKVVAWSANKTLDLINKKAKK